MYCITKQGPSTVPPKIMQVTIKKSINNYRTPDLERTAQLHLSVPHFVLDSIVVKAQIVYLVWRLPTCNLCNASSQGNKLIKLTHFDEIKKKAHDSQMVRAKQNLKLSTSGSSQRQASGTHQRMQNLRQGHH